MDDWWAHSPLPDKGVPPHLLKDHLRAVAKLAEKNAQHFAIAHAQALLVIIGYLHDIGKYRLKFQKARLGHDPETGQYHPKSGERVDHSTLGALLLFPPTSLANQPTRRAMEAASRVVAAHHAGLANTNSFEHRIFTKQNSLDRAQAMARAVVELEELSEVAGRMSGIGIDLPPTSLEFFTRMLLSCLVDADYVDTEQHLDPKAAAIRVRPVATLRTLWERLEVSQEALSPTSRLDTLRRSMYLEALSKAEEPQGIFRLTMPTGAGKTRTSLAFALCHAQKHGLSRVVYAIPFTSIIDQVAGVFRGILDKPGENNILEHHSAVDESGGEGDDTGLWAKALSESWEAPVIVTTTVQLFESLFANRPSKVRKLKSLAGSVIVLDEVQTLPTRLLKPILDALNELVTRYNATVILCTATQPALERTAGFNFDALGAVKDIIPAPARYFNELRRVDFHLNLDEPLAWPEVVKKMTSRDHALCIVNLKRHATELMSLLKESDPSAILLSTQFYPHHRRELLAEVRSRLVPGSVCRVVATSLVECGVDLDFPLVLRALGPLDSIVQAAGRCNREGLLKDAAGNELRGEVHVFEPEDRATLRGEHELKTHAARQAIAASSDLYDPETFLTYFRRVYQSSETDAHEIMRAREDLDFETVASRFKMIDSDTVPVVVTSRTVRGVHEVLETPRRLLTELESEEAPRHGLWRELQQYAFNIYRNEIKGRSAFLRQVIAPGGVALDLYEWMGLYDDRLGPVEVMDLDRFFV